MEEAIYIGHNQHQLGDLSSFQRLDPQLRRLADMPYPYEAPLLEALPQDTPGIYTLGGGRQIGKTTLLKQWIAHLIHQGMPPNSITFLTGEIIPDDSALIQTLQKIIGPTETDRPLSVVIIDEITYIQRWQMAIKFVADAGMLDRTILMLSGSDLSFIQEASKSFPGRRGRATQHDYHLYPLSFGAFVSLTQDMDTASIKDDALHPLFEQYLLHGGYLTAINDYAADAAVHSATMKTYADWISGDMLRRGKQEKYLKELLGAIVKRYGSQVSWHALGKDLSIDHHKTISDYCELLEKMDALTIVSALLEDKLVGAPKKAKKIYFNDPFIFHTINAWLHNSATDLTDPVTQSRLVEGVVLTHHKRLHDTYYIKSTSHEIDLAYVEQKQFHPIEIKWTNQIRPEDVRHIKKYERSLVLTKLTNCHMDSIKTAYLPRHLLELPL